MRASLPRLQLWAKRHHFNRQIRQKYGSFIPQLQRRISEFAGEAQASSQRGFEYSKVELDLADPTYNVQSDCKNKYVECAMFGSDDMKSLAKILG